MKEDKRDWRIEKKYGLSDACENNTQIADESADAKKIEARLILTNVE